MIIPKMAHILLRFARKIGNYETHQPKQSGNAIIMIILFAIMNHWDESEIIL